MSKAASQLNGTWTSLPGGPQEQMPKSDVESIVKNIISNELNDKSVIASPKGSLKL